MHKVIGLEARADQTFSISWRQLHAMLTDYSPLDVALFTKREASAKWLSLPIEVLMAQR